MTATTRRPTTNASPSTSWMPYGLCRQVDADLFFPEGRGTSITTQTDHAKTVCNRCPVKSRCLDWAVETGQSSGVWGGLSEDERRPLLRERAAQRQSGYSRCIEQQEFIEQRVAEGASHREIGDELGVCHTSVGRAWRFFQSERQVSQSEQVKAA